jgi:hypothetical protein
MGKGRENEITKKIKEKVLTIREYLILQEG